MSPAIAAMLGRGQAHRAWALLFPRTLEMTRYRVRRWTTRSAAASGFPLTGKLVERRSLPAPGRLPARPLPANSGS